MSYSLIFVLAYCILFFILLFVTVGYFLAKRKISINPIVISLFGIQITLLGGFLLLGDFNNYGFGEYIEVLSWLLLLIGFIVTMLSLFLHTNRNEK